MKVEWTVVPKDQEAIEATDAVIELYVDDGELRGLGENQQAAVIDGLVMEAFHDHFKLSWRKIE